MGIAADDFQCSEGTEPGMAALNVRWCCPQRWFPRRTALSTRLWLKEGFPGLRWRPQEWFVPPLGQAGRDDMVWGEGVTANNVRILSPRKITVKGAMASASPAAPGANPGL